MKVLLVNSYDYGGAANACLRLHGGLNNAKIDSKVLLSRKVKNYHNTFLFRNPQIQSSIKNKIIVKFKRIIKEFKFLRGNQVNEKDLFIRNRSKELELFSFPDSEIDITTSELYLDAEIVNLHWVANFLNYKTFFENNKKPVVWTLHDMNPFTGGEHYKEEYLGIDDFGFPIKRIKTEEEISLDQKIIKFKIEAISKAENLIIVAPSKWLADQARDSEVFKEKPVYCIPNGVDPEIFTNRDKVFSRELLNIPKDKKVFLFVADSISNNRKGFVFLKRAFEQLKDPKLVLCAIGNKNSDLESIDNLIELGPIHDERLMSAAYSAADVFVIPSLMDNLPNTVLESLMCGTPVIGFPVGGISDMIQEGVNGLLTKEISVPSLLETMIKFLNSDEKFDTIKIRKDAIMNYDIKIQSSQYIKLFESLINKESFEI